MKRFVYSFGPDSPMKFVITEKLAKNYNEAVREFFRAQTRFNQKFGKSWDPRVDPIEIRWTDVQRKAWNEFSNVFRSVLAADGPFHANDISDDFLVKNVSQGASASSQKFARALTVVVTSAVVYELLRRR